MKTFFNELLIKSISYTIISTVYHPISTHSSLTTHHSTSPRPHPSHLVHISADNKGCTPLHYLTSVDRRSEQNDKETAKENAKEIAKNNVLELLQCGADPFIRDKQGHSCAYYAGTKNFVWKQLADELSDVLNNAISISTSTHNRIYLLNCRVETISLFFIYSNDSL